MLLAFDIGNSSVSVGVFKLSRDSHELLTSFKISNKPYSADEYVMFLRVFLRENGFRTYEKNCTDENMINCAVVSSVVPELTDIICAAAAKLCGRNPFIISEGKKTGFGIKIKNPEQLGSDIVCNVAAALHLSSAPLVILDMGTATTITVVDKNGNVLGTIITPGLAVSMKALSDSAALLGNIRLERENVLIGRDSEESINSGVINGNIFMIDGFIRNIREQIIPRESGEKLSLLATGGLSESIIPYTKNKFIYYKNLTLEGAAYLFEKNVALNFV